MSNPNFDSRYAKTTDVTAAIAAQAVADAGQYAPLSGVVTTVSGLSPFSTSTDNASIISAAINAAPVGGTIRLPIGTYGIGNAGILITRSDVRVVGSGPNTVLKLLENSLTTGGDPWNTNIGAIIRIGVVSSSNSATRYSNITITDLTIDGNHAGQTGVYDTTSGGYGILARWTDGITIDRVQVNNCNASGLYTWSCSAIRVTNSMFRTNGQSGTANYAKNGLDIGGSSTNTYDAGRESLVSQCVFDGNFDSGIGFSTVSNFIITNNTFKNHAYAGVEGIPDANQTAVSPTSPRNVIISSNHFLANATHLLVQCENDQNVVINGNHFKDASAKVVDIEQGSTGTVTFTNNIVENWKTTDTSTSIHGFYFIVDDLIFTNNNLKQTATSWSGSGGSVIELAWVRRADISHNKFINAYASTAIIEILLTSRAANTEYIGIFENYFNGPTDAIRFTKPYTTYALYQLDVKNNFFYQLGTTTQRSCVGIWNDRGFDTCTVMGNRAYEKRGTKYTGWGVFMQTGSYVANLNILDNDFGDTLYGSFTNNGTVATTLNRFSNISMFGQPNKGTTTSRPTLTALDKGFPYYDTTLALPITWNGTGWVNAAGSSV